MKTGRPDFDAMMEAHSIPSDEPCFPVRGQDAFGADTARDWAHRAWKGGASSAIVELALQQADRMEAWPVKKIPDVRHLTDDENNNLAYQLERRAWNAREDAVGDPRILLAEVRGRRAGVAYCRTVLGGTMIDFDDFDAAVGTVEDAPEAEEPANGG